MDINKVYNIMKDREVGPLDVVHKFSVLIPLIKIGDEIHVIFEKRSNTLKDQPGEISFPGGKIEENETPKEAAIRETMEELNLDSKNIKLIAETDYLISKDLFAINCFVGSIEDVEFKDIVPNEGEVDYLFTVPLDFFLEVDPIMYCLNLYVEHNKSFPYELIPNGENYDWKKAPYSVYFYTYEDHIIWGFTAKMAYNFIKILRGEK